jgi:hypothetical protein
LVALTGKKWSSTLLGTIIGLLFLYPTAGVPFFPHIAISLIVNGLVFDLYLNRSKTSPYELPRRQIVTASALGNFAMAVAGLLAFQVFSPGIIQSATLGPVSLTGAPLWAFFLIADTLVGVAGGFFGSIVIDRVKGAQTRRALEARASLRVKA